MTKRPAHLLSTATSAAVFLLLVIAGRVLGPQDFGRLSFALALTFLFDPILDPGFSHLTIREVARERESAGMYLFHAVGWKLLIVPVLLLFVRWFLPKVDPSPAAWDAVLLIAGAGVLKSVADAVRAVFMAGKHTARELGSRAFGNVGLMAAGLLALAMGGGLYGIAVVFFAVRAAELAMSWALVWRDMGGLTFRVEPTFLGRMLTNGAPVAAFYVTAFLFGQISTVGLAWFGTQTEVGQFSAAMRLCDVLLLIPLALGALAYPRMERLHGDDDEGFMLMMRGGLRFSYGLGLLVAGNAILLSGPLMRFFFGEGYGPAVDVFRLLVLGLPAVFALHYLNTAFISMGGLRIVFLCAFAGVALTAGFNAWWIPERSHLGAAASLVAVHILLFAAMFLRVRRRVPGVAFSLFVHLSLCALPAVAVAWFANRWGAAAQVILGNAAFLGLVLLSGFVREDERKAILERLPGGRKG